MDRCDYFDVLEEAKLNVAWQFNVLSGQFHNSTTITMMYSLLSIPASRPHINPHYIIQASFIRHRPTARNSTLEQNRQTNWSLNLPWNKNCHKTISPGFCLPFVCLNRLVGNAVSTNTHTHTRTRTRLHTERGTSKTLRKYRSYNCWLIQKLILPHYFSFRMSLGISSGRTKRVSAN